MHHMVLDLKICLRKKLVLMCRAMIFFSVTGAMRMNWVKYEPPSLFLMYTSYDQESLTVSWLHEIYTCVNIFWG